MTKDSKTKVFIDAFAISKEKKSGIGHVLLSLLREFDKKTSGFEFVLVASPKAIKFIKSNYKFNNFRYKTVPFSGRIFNGLIIYGLMPPVDLYLGRGIYLFPNFTKWPLLFSKSVTYIHDLSYLLFPDVLRPDVLKALKRNVSKWVKTTTKIIAISKNTKADIIKLLQVEDSKIEIVYCGVDSSIFYRRTKQEINKIIERYNLPENYLLFVSNIEPRKNIPTLLKAYTSLPKIVRDEHPLLLIGGESWGSDGLKEEVKRLQKEGYKILKPSKYVEDEDLPAIYSAANVLIHPALYEGFGLSPLQAMACGTPAIVACNSSLKEVYSKSALMFDSRNPKELSDRIQILINDKKIRHKYINNGKQLAENYTWRKSARSVISLLKSLG